MPLMSASIFSTQCDVKSQAIIVAPYVDKKRHSFNNYVLNSHTTLYSSCDKSKILIVFRITQ